MRPIAACCKFVCNVTLSKVSDVLITKSLLTCCKKFGMKPEAGHLKSLPCHRVHRMTMYAQVDRDGALLYVYLKLPYKKIFSDAAHYQQTNKQINKNTNKTNSSTLKGSKKSR